MGHCNLTWDNVEKPYNPYTMGSRKFQISGTAGVTVGVNAHIPTSTFLIIAR